MFQWYIYIYNIMIIPWASKTIQSLAFSWGPFFAVTAYTLPFLALLQVSEDQLGSILSQRNMICWCMRLELRNLYRSITVASANPKKSNRLEVTKMISKGSCHFLISNVVPGQWHDGAPADLDSGDTRQQSHDYRVISYDRGNVLPQFS